jgi:acyl-CoA synthetase (AMP-forming)/AMP-acid ligase II
VPTETTRRLRELIPDTEIFLMYGLTEAFRSTFLPPDQVDIRPTSIGRAIPECEVFAITADGQRAKPGKPGILVHRGPTVSLGYWNRPEDTAKVLRPNPLVPLTQGGDTVCYSGDLVIEDEDGYFSFVGRADAMIKSSGYRISPSEVEEVLMATGSFRQVAVIGLPDPLIGQKVHAIAIASSDQADVGAILQMISNDLPNFMVPRAIELVEELPTTPNGKIDYPLLAQQRVSNVGH